MAAVWRLLITGRAKRGGCDGLHLLRREGMAREGWELYLGLIFFLIFFFFFCFFGLLFRKKRLLLAVSALAVSVLLLLLGKGGDRGRIDRRLH